MGVSPGTATATRTTRTRATRTTRTTRATRTTRTTEKTTCQQPLWLLFLFLALAARGAAALTISDCTNLIPVESGRTGAAINASSGDIYVVIHGEHKVVKYASGSSTAVTVAGGNGQGSATSQLNFPWAVLLLDGDLIISDMTNRRIMRWTPGAAIGTVWGPFGDSLGFEPRYMELTDSNELLLTAWDNANIFKIDTVGSLHVLPKAFGYVIRGGFARDPLGGQIYFTRNSDIYDFTTSASVLTTNLFVNADIRSMKIDSAGQVWVGLLYQKGILRCNIDLGICDQYLAGEFWNTEAILFDATNTNLYVLTNTLGLWQCPTPPLPTTTVSTSTATSTSSSSSSITTSSTSISSTISSTSTATTTTSCSSTTSISSSTTSSSSGTVTSTSTTTSSSTATSSSTTSSSTSATSSSTTTSSSLTTTTSTSVSATSTSSSTSATSTSTSTWSTSTTSTSTGSTTLSTSTTTTTTSATTSSTTTTVTSTSTSSGTSTSMPTTSTTSTMSTSLTTSTTASGTSSSTTTTPRSRSTATTSSTTSTSSSTHTNTGTASRRISTTSTTSSSTGTNIETSRASSSTASTSTSSASTGTSSTSSLTLSPTSPLTLTSSSSSTSASTSSLLWTLTLTSSSGTMASTSTSTSPTAPTQAPGLAEVLEPVANVSSDLLVRLQSSAEDHASASIPGGSLTALRLDTLERLTNWSGNGDGDGSAANSSGGIDITITISVADQAEDKTEKAETVDMKMTLPQELFQAFPASSAPQDSLALLVSTFSSESTGQLTGQRGQEPGSGQVVDLQVLSVASIDLRYILSGESLEVQGLEKPIIFQLPGTNYSTASLCAYWEEDTQLWSFEGVDTPEDSNNPGQLMVCHTKHLSVFGAIMPSVSTTTTTMSGTVTASTSTAPASASTSTTVSTSEGGTVPMSTTASNDDNAPTPAPATTPTSSEPPSAAEAATELLDSVANATAYLLGRLQDSEEATVSIPGGSVTALKLDTTNSSGEGITVSVFGVEGTMVITLPWEVIEGVPASPVPGDSLALVVASFSKQSAGSLGGQRNEEDSGQIAELQVASVISLDLYYIFARDAVEVQKLQDPIVFKIPGANYTAGMLCAYWEETRQLWSFDSVATPEGDNSPGQTLVCHTYHLSFFAAILQSFISTLKCAQFNLLSSEAIKNLFNDAAWLNSPGACMCWSVYAGLALFFGWATFTDWKRDQRLCWKDEFFLVATAETGPEGGTPGVGVGDGEMDPEDSRASPVEGEGEGGGLPLHSVVLQLALQGGSTCLQCLWGSTALRDATDEIMGSWCEYWGDIRGALESFWEVVGQGVAGGPWSELGHKMGGMLLLASSRRLAAASMGMTNEAVTFVLEDEDLQDYLTETHQNEPVGTRAHDWKTSEDQRVAWMSLHDHVVHHVLDHTGRHTACRLPRVAAEFFVFHNPVSGLFMHDIFHSCKKRVLLLAVDLLGSMAMSVVFFESVGMVRGKPIQTDDDCGGDSSLAGMIGRLLAIATGSLIVSGVPLTLIDSLHTKGFRKLDYRGSEAWKKQLRIWATQDRMVWALSLLYVGFCAFFVLVFVASIGPTDHKSWSQAGILVVIEDFVMIPAFLAFTVPLLTAVFLEVLRSVHGTDRDTVLRKSQENLFRQTNAMNPITRI